MTPAVGWIDATPRPGFENMARDVAMWELAEERGGTWIRLYRWDPFCLSFGRHEPASRRYDRSRIASLGLDCVRRPTGGRAVWHARELTYAVAAPLSTLGSLRQAYHQIHSWLASAVAALGLAVELAPPGTAPGVGAGACFAQAVGGELVVGSRKILGSAQRRGERALLQHGSLLLEDDQSLVREVARTNRASPPIQDGPEAPLSVLLGHPVSFDRAAAAIATTLAQLGVADFDAEPPAVLNPRAALHLNQFRSDRWTWER